jgi:predicted nucleotidyltransferase
MGTEVWLYGSTARGDRDGTSDVDILVAGNEVPDLSAIAASMPGHLSVSRYSWEELDQMAGYGSLFLHHLRLEGQPIVETGEKRLKRLLRRLGPYARAGRELSCFSRVVDDVEHTLEADHSVPFELSVLATAARHAAILGCYALGEPDFGRTSPFRRLLPRLGYPEAAIQQFVDLYTFRRADDEDRPPELKRSTEDARTYAAAVRNLIRGVRALAKCADG